MQVVETFEKFPNDDGYVSFRYGSRLHLKINKKQKSQYPCLRIPLPH